MTRVVIVGGGIGGIATALALRRHHIDYVVLEQAQQFAEVGAGIQLSPNGMRVLAGLGTASALAPMAVEPIAHRFRDWQTGETLLELPLGPAVREAFGAPYLHAHRADLLGTMLDALAARGASHGRPALPADDSRRFDPEDRIDRLGGDRVRLGCRVAAVRQNGTGAEAVLEDGTVERGDVLVGADGIHSLVRDLVSAPEEPRPSGFAAWRGLVPADQAIALGIERYSYVWLGPGRSVVLYYVSAGRLLNWVGIGPSPEALRESWSATGSREALLRDHEGWHPQITGLLAATERPFLTRLYDRHPLAEWVRGRVALLGDAAHPMLPYHAQGAVQSLEDAWVLARCLADAVPQAGDAPPPRDADPVARALVRYEQLRKDRASQVQAYSRAAQDWYHLSEPSDLARRAERFRAVARRGPAGFSTQQEWLYAYDAEKAALGEDAEWRAMQWSAREP